MYTLQIKCRHEWRWSIRLYETYEEAEKRVKELKEAGIKARIRFSKELCMADDMEGVEQ